jgi:O-antigen ligase
MFGISLIIAGSRTGYAAYFLIISYFLIRQNIKLLYSCTGIVIFITLATGIFIGGDYVKRRARLMKKLSLFVTLDHERAVLEGKSTTRLAYWAGALKMFRGSPWMGVGIGKKNYLSRFPHHLIRASGRPHNTYLYILASTGFTGFLILGLFLLSIVKRGYCAWKSEKNKGSMREKTLHIIFANILILVMQLGYQFETEPFVWMFWGLSFSWFYQAKQTSQLKRYRSQIPGRS